MVTVITGLGKVVADGHGHPLSSVLACVLELHGARMPLGWAVSTPPRAHVKRTCHFSSRSGSRWPFLPLAVWHAPA